MFFVLLWNPQICETRQNRQTLSCGGPGLFGPRALRLWAPKLESWLWALLPLCQCQHLIIYWASLMPGFELSYELDDQVMVINGSSPTLDPGPSSPSLSPITAQDQNPMMRANQNETVKIFQWFFSHCLWRRRFIHQLLWPPTHKRKAKPQQTFFSIFLSSAVEYFVVS